MSVRGPRRQSREAALQLLYAADVADRLDSHGIEEAAHEIILQFHLPLRARRHARELAEGVVTHRKLIDDRIAAASRRWKLHRLATVDRNILRIATYELLFDPGIPTEVVIDEALEVARRFGGDASPRFINGVLDLIARSRPDGPA